MKKTAIENQFKEKMKEREIIPSKNSWDRLDAMLTVAEKPKRNFKWMYIAASFLGFLLISTLYFNNSHQETVVNSDAIVNNDTKVVPEINVTPTKINLANSVKKIKVVEEQIASKEIKSKVDSNNISTHNEVQVAQNEKIVEPQIPIINQKAEQEIVLRKSNYVNVDELLASVDNNSQKNSPVGTKTNVKVNSANLLSQVDGELELTFREKAINTVNKKFSAAKLALSNRNSE
jgi:hypothetical protein